MTKNCRKAQLAKALPDGNGNSSSPIWFGGVEAQGERNDIN